MKFYIWVIFEKPSRKFKFQYHRTRITGTLHDDQYTFISMRNVSDKRCTGNQNTYSVFSNYFFQNRYEIMCKNNVERSRPHMTIGRMRISCCKATNTLTICCCCCCNYYYYYYFVEFLTSQLWLGHIHLSWDVVINRIRLGGLICSLKSFLQLNMCQELQIFAVVYMYSGTG